MNKNIKDYQAIDILGKSVPELIVKVYDGAIGNLDEAIGFYKAEDLKSGYESMEQAKKFIVHLYTTLDQEKGGEIAKNLSKLYAFIMEQINFVQATKSISAIEDSMAVLTNIREGWMQLAQQTKQKPATTRETDQTAITSGNISLSV